MKSSECQLETNMAITLWAKSKKPVIMPVVLPDMHSRLMEGVMMTLSSNFNALLVDSEDPSVIVAKVASALG